MKALLTSVLFLASITSFADTVKCSVGSLTTGEKIDVPVLVINGNQIARQETVEYQNNEYSVIWNQGSIYEGQTSLAMYFGENNSSVMYDFSPEGQIGPVNVLTINDARFQCGVARE